MFRKTAGPTNFSRLFNYIRPASYWDVVCVHLPLALAAGIPLLMAHFLPIARVPAVPCTFLSLSGYPCPFCGLTRSFWAMAEGDFAYAFYNSPLGGVAYVLAAFVFAWNATALISGLKIAPGRVFRIKTGRRRWLIAALVLLVMLNWGYRLSLGLK